MGKKIFKNDVIFKNFSSKKNYLNYLNLLCRDMYYEKTDENIIFKIFFNNNKFDWELYIIFTLEAIQLKIYPDIININYSKMGSYIEFNITDLRPLREIFENNSYNFHLIINELLSFLRQIRLKGVVIGNLHIDSIYINTSKMRFYILDLSNTTFTDSSSSDLHLQSLYLSLHETNIKEKVIRYFDQEVMLSNDDVSKYSYTNSLLELYK